MVRNSIDDFCSLIDRVIHSKDCKKFQNASVDEKNDYFSQYDTYENFWKILHMTVSIQFTQFTFSRCRYINSYVFVKKSQIGK